MFGLILNGIQLLVYNGIIDLNWTIIHSALKDIFADQEVSLERIKSVLLVNLPFAVAAGIDFILGLKKG